MAGRYDSSTYAIKGFNPQSTAYTPSADDQKKKRDSDMWRFIGDVAPAAGTALGMGAGALIGGGIPGATLGAGLGGAAGTALGGLAHGYAENEVQPQDDAQHNAQNRQMQTIEMLNMLRR